MNYFTASLALHKKLKGKTETKAKMPITGKEDLALLYTPWVAEPCREIAKDPSLAYEYTQKGNTILVVSDGSAILGLWNIGPEAGLPVMEGKCVLFKELGDVNAVPIMLATQDTEEIIRTVKAIAPAFGGVNLEDISAPRCFEIENRLKAELNIPVMHDDQHATAIVSLAGLINALKITGKKKEEIVVVINGLWAAGTAILKLFHLYGVRHFIACDSKGIISKERTDLNAEKQEILALTQTEKNGSVHDAIVGADVFVGVSVAGALDRNDVAKMNKDAIIFAMANPMPEIMPDEAKAGGARIIATGRSDFPNQVNNVLAFPGIFKGVLENRKKAITEEMKLNVAEALANMVENPTEEYIIPNALDPKVVVAVAEAVKKST